MDWLFNLAFGVPAMFVCSGALFGWTFFICWLIGFNPWHKGGDRRDR
jgi:hypothetical protein